VERNNAEWITGMLEARAVELEPYAAYLSCGASRALESMVLVVKGKRGKAEEAGGAPLSGRDGAALQSAFMRLGWENTDGGAHNWCGVLLTPRGVAPLAADTLRLLIETIDPMVVVALDGQAFQAVSSALLSRQAVAATQQPAGRTGQSADGAWQLVDRTQKPVDRTQSPADRTSVRATTSQPITWSPGKTTDAGGRLLVSVNGFEAALGAETDKQLVWKQLKQASRAEVLKRFK